MDHLRSTYLGPLLMIFKFLEVFPLDVRKVPAFNKGTSFPKSMPNWFLDNETGVPLIWMFMGNFFTSWSFIEITKLSLNLPLASLNIVITIFWLCLLFRTPEEGSQVMLIPESKINNLCCLISIFFELGSMLCFIGKSDPFGKWKPFIQTEEFLLLSS